jgi:hypothetical protein
MLIKSTPFKYMTVSEAINLLSTSRDIEVAKLNRVLYDGDHWMEGEGWIGPIPDTNDQTYDEMKEEIRKIFCSRNVCKEVVDRKVDGLLKSRPQMSYYLREISNNINEDQKAANKKLTDRAGRLFRKWFKDKKVLKRVKEIYGRSQLDEPVTARLYVPRGLLTKVGNKTRFPKGTIEECLELIHLSIEVSDQVGEIIHPSTQIAGMICDIKRGSEQFTELVYVDGKDTVIRTIRGVASDVIAIPESVTANSRNQLGTEFRMDIGGHLTMYESKVRATITQQVRENQMAINLAKTMQSRNIVTAGFLERIIMDAMPPGKWIQDPDDEQNEIYEVGPFKLGGGTTNFMMAAEYRNKDTGETHFGNPTVYYRDPVDPGTFISSKRDCYQDILEEVGQPHILTTGTEGSGRTKEQAKDTYRGTLEDDEGEISPLIEWMMLTVLNMAAFFSSESTQTFRGLGAEAKCYLNLGPLTGNERQDNREDAKAGQLSIRTSMMRSGIEDPQAEFDRLGEESGITDEAIRNKVDMMEKLVGMGFTPESVAIAIGLPKEKRDALVYKPPEPEEKTDPAPDPQNKNNNPRGLSRPGQPMN